MDAAKEKHAEESRDQGEKKWKFSEILEDKEIKHRKVEVDPSNILLRQPNWVDVPNNDLSK